MWSILQTGADRSSKAKDFVQLPKIQSDRIGCLAHLSQIQNKRAESRRRLPNFSASSKSGDRNRSAFGFIKIERPPSFWLRQNWTAKKLGSYNRPIF